MNVTEPLLYIITHAKNFFREENPLKNLYKKPIVSLLYFDEQDLITESPSEFDGVGYIPDDWYTGWSVV